MRVSFVFVVLKFFFGQAVPFIVTISPIKFADFLPEMLSGDIIEPGFSQNLYILFHVCSINLKGRSQIYVMHRLQGHR